MMDLNDYYDLGANLHLASSRSGRLVETPLDRGHSNLQGKEPW